MQEPEQSYKALRVSDAASLPSGLGSGFGGESPEEDGQPENDL